MPDEAPKKPQSIRLDGDHVANMLKGAGLDPHKFDVRKALPGAHIDYQELESRLKGTHPAAAKGSGGWHVTVSISKD